MKIVLLSGKQGSGKSTIQRFLMARAPMAVQMVGVQVNFADALYALHDAVQARACEWYGLEPKKKDGVLLQLLGTEWGRKVHGDDVWIRCIKQRMNDWGFPMEPLFIVGDCRFQNEFDAFPEALRVRLHAAETTRQKRTESWRDNTRHQSETDLDGYAERGLFDMVIQTDGLVTADGATELILAQLQKNNWLEKRRSM